MSDSVNRKEYIGSSDIASVMGLSRWRTPLQLWALKTGRVEPDDLSEVEHIQLGTELEEFVAQKFSKESGLKVRRAPQHYVHPDHFHFRAQIDRLITGTDEILECKTASAWKAKEWEGEDIPQEYILQVMWQLGVSGKSTGWIAVLIGGQAFKFKKIEFDQELFDRMLSEAVKFWEMVENETPPMAMGDDNYFILELYPESDERIEQVEELNDKIALRQQLKNTIDETMEHKDEIEAQIKQVIGDNLGIKTSEYLVTWKRQPRASVDTKLLKDNGVYEQYVKRSNTRVLRVRKEKKKEKE